jgi:hypothetical protein
VEKNVNKFVKYGKEGAKVAGSFATKLIRPIAAGLMVNDATERYHEYLKEGMSKDEAFFRSGLDAFASFMTFGLSDKAPSHYDFKRDNLNVRAIADNPMYYNQPIPNMAHISPVAASVLNQPSSGQDYHIAVANQIFQAQQTQYIKDATEKMKDLFHPIAPAYGVTIPTTAGELTLTQNEKGYLRIGDYQTNVPMSDFRSYVNQNPAVLPQLANTLVNSGLYNENVYDKFGRGYEKQDNGQIESLLANLNYFQRVSTKDSQIGFSTMTDFQEKMTELLEELSTSKEEKDKKEFK